MKRISEIAALIAAITLAAVSCGHREGKNGFDWESATLEEKLEYMRTDSSWIARLDSLADIHIGQGARCTDAVKHTFIYDGRTWFYNQDWGGVLEIPGDYLVEDDDCQVELSFHGTRIFSPDSLVLISTYAGLQCGFDALEFVEMAKAQFDDQPHVKVTSFRETEVCFRNGHVSRAVEMETLSDDAIAGFARYIFSSPEGVEYNAFIQFPREMSQEISGVIDMLKRYPFSPDGSDPVGECI